MLKRLVIINRTPMLAEEKVEILIAEKLEKPFLICWKNKGKSTGKKGKK